jgi:hypothetical protein
MFDTETTNPVDGDAMPEVVDALDTSENEALNPVADNQEIEDGQDGEGEAEGAEPELVEVEFEGETLAVPAKVKDALLRQADYTRKTQEVAEERKAVETRAQTLAQNEQRQMQFAQEIAQLGALNDRLAPYQNVDWPSHIRQTGAEGQAQYAEFQALQAKRDRFAQGLGHKVQEQAAELQRETAKQVEAGRAELAKHIKGYSPEALNKLTEFGSATYGFSSDEIRQAEADPRSIRVLHDAAQWRQHLARQQKTSTLAQGQQTRPVPTLRGAGGQFQPSPERMSPEQMAKHLGLRS